MNYFLFPVLLLASWTIPQSLAAESTPPDAKAKTVTADVAGVAVTYIPAPKNLPIADGPFKPDWNSLQQYQFPEWFRNAKFGIWAHWGPQCLPEQGDWYARKMYIPGTPAYDAHLKRFGHPSVFGFKDICNAWKAEKFDPEKLLALYKKAGAKYFVAMANHHDNFDLWDSKFQPWNSVNIGPKKNLIEMWANAARKEGLRFGVSIHASNTWNWYEVTQLSDKTGPKAGVPYDGKLTKADGKGTWWEGYDPQDLYAQNHKPSPVAGGDVREEAKAPGDPTSPEFCLKYYNRVLDVVDRYKPDLVYFDDFVLPMARRADSVYGLNITAHIYNSNLARNGRNEAVVNTKVLDDMQQKCLVRDYEMAIPTTLQPEPWQTDACIGSWHYVKGKKYRSAASVIRAFVDIVSKNGNLLLNIPVRGDGTIDDAEIATVEKLGSWMAINSEAIYDTRPWTKFGEGPSLNYKGTISSKGGVDMFSKGLVYTAQDVRFTTKGHVLYAIALDWPETGKLLIKSLAAKAPGVKGEITKVSLLGAKDAPAFRQTAEGLEVTLPKEKPCEAAYALKIEGVL
jgi:alpha-L-fucosidase